MSLAKAREYLRGAEFSLSENLPNVCATCCYYAIFWAAITALEREGFRQKEWSHGGLRDTFSMELVKRRQKYQTYFARLIRESYELRRIAHYELSGVSEKSARRMLGHAQEFIIRVEEVTRR